MNDLERLLRPRSIAVVGASPDFGKVNGRPLKYLLGRGYSGRIFPVNPKYAEIAGLRCYPEVAAISEPVDLALIALPAASVPAVIPGLGRHGVRWAIVFSSGFSEIGEAGRAREQELVAAARAANVRLCGPNCLGLINAFERVAATFGQYAERELVPGPVAFVTQSGAFGTAIAALARRRGIGLGYFINTGNEADLGFAEAMRAVLSDPRIRVGAGYIEGLRDGDALLALAQEALALGKPLVLTKVGRGRAGARAAASHTGALAGEDVVFEGVMRQYGLVRARNEEHMLDLIEAFICCEPPAGHRLGIATQSGGAGVLMADRAEELGLAVPVLERATQEALRAAIPGFAAVSNPVDITGQFVAQPELLGEGMRLLLADPEVDIAVAWLQLMEAHVAILTGILGALKESARKPFLVAWVAAPEQALEALRLRGIAVLRGAEPAVDACAALVRYGAARRAWLAEPQPRRSPGIVIPALPAAPGPMKALAARALLEAAGVRTAPSLGARSRKEATAVARRLGFPVAVKIDSPDIPHKTEAGGVRLGLRDAAEVRAAFDEVLANAKRHAPAARADTVLVQPMLSRGVELAVGLHRDALFGPVLMVGLGGVRVEAFRDVVFRKAPVTSREALAMLEELRGRALLDGVRGEPAVDRGALAALLCAVSHLPEAAGDRLKELDLNPVLASAEGAVALDWLVVLT